MLARAAVIRLEQLSKRYGRVDALRGVDLAVDEGEIFGFLGLNGAGKSTTIRILLDLVRPTSGRALVYGADCRTRGIWVRERVGYLPSELGFYGDMTGQATLDVLGRLGSPVDTRWRDELLERLRLERSDLRRRLREYSTGMKRKIGIVQAFQSRAPLLILDEPTEGLDPLMQDAFYELLADVRRQGTTVFMSSHVLPEVERVCDRIGLLRGGELAIVSTVADIRRVAARRVRVTFDTDVAAPARWPSGWEAIDIAAREWDLRVTGPLAALPPILAPLPTKDIDVREPHLEDVLRQYYGGGDDR